MRSERSANGNGESWSDAAWGKLSGSTRKELFLPVSQVLLPHIAMQGKGKWSVHRKEPAPEHTHSSGFTHTHTHTHINNDAPFYMSIHEQASTGIS